MKKTGVLRRNGDFRRLYARGKSGTGRYVVVYVSKNRRGENRLGLTAGKKIGGAVERNRAKRLMRESYRLIEDSVRSGIDMVIVARSRILTAKCGDVTVELARVFEELGVTDGGEHLGRQKR